MATDKRDRQRANRADKQAREAKAKRRSDSFQLVKRWALYGGLIIAVFVLAAILFRS